MLASDKQMYRQLEHNFTQPHGRIWRSPRAGPPTRIAALDLGTNNCRLLVAEPGGTGFEVVDSFSRITRLGEGLAATGKLSEAAIHRTLTALSVCRRIIDRNHVAELRCVATEACRRAVNGATFIGRVEREIGIDLEVVTQDEEARLALLGCLPLVDSTAEFLLMVDIGGGSTEVVWFDRTGRNPVSDERGIAVSLPVGVVTLAESFASEVERGEYKPMFDRAREIVAAAPLSKFHPCGVDEAAVQMLGTSGTVTTLAAVHLGLRRYDRRRVDGIVLAYDAISAVAERLKRLGNRGRAAHPCIGQGRADLVIAGCAILDAIHDRWPLRQMRVADRGVREGILHGLMGLDLGALTSPKTADTW
jgi:exopolyphosphatase/guanosine-5'-triphosphate,3'-diphosphate pyrophosphatase